MLILRFVCLPWNINTGGQCLNWDFLKVFHRKRHFSKEKRSWWFRYSTFAFKHIIRNVFIKFQFLFYISTQVSHYCFPKFYLHLFWPIHSHILSQKLSNDNNQCLMSCSFFNQVNANSRFFPTFSKTALYFSKTASPPRMLYRLSYSIISEVANINIIQ